jgi:hypothetical protein
MPYGEMTVGDLRKAIFDLDDSVTLVINPDAEDFQSQEPYRLRDSVTGEVVRVPGKPAKVWNYNTRFVQNIYTANDDRLDNNQILIICIGEPLP